MIPDFLFALPLASISKEAERQGVFRELVVAIAWHESHGRVYATRMEPGYKWTYEVEKFAKMHFITRDTEQYLQSQSYGLMQIMGATARDMGFQGPLPTLYEPENNLFWGVKYLKSLMQRYDVLKDVISAYNQGKPRKNADGKYKNQFYVDTVLATTLSIK